MCIYSAYDFCSNNKDLIISIFELKKSFCKHTVLLNIDQTSV